jgi:hydrogenase maturation protein HypF
MKNLKLEKRVRILVKGIVQGVGFRPFLYRSAHKFKLSGFVKNTAQGVILEVEGKEGDIEDFNTYIIENPPPLSLIESHETQTVPVQGSDIFEIVSSEADGEGDLLVSPDIAICDNCKRELFLRSDRRYGYPFINCTDCGPRFSIIVELPYDRPKTTMKDFVMCPQCETEYGDPYDRRYHAQPVSCYDCGPTLSLYDREQNKLENPLDTTARKLKEGAIIAVKGLGGYHLACIAAMEPAVLRMRELKGRETKPFALMGMMEMIMEYAEVSEEEKKLLLSPAAPILLLRRKDEGRIAHSAAPGLGELGFMLPYTPLHLLLLEKVNEPLVMTSANITDEPIVYKDDMEALRALSDYILTNDREIRIFEDDSVARVFDGGLYMVRRSRGFVPLPLKMALDYPETILALGPMLKTTFAFLFKGKAIMGQYIGDTDSPASIEAEREALDHFMRLFSLKPGIVVMDKHPGYPNREIAEDEVFKGAKKIEIQHHEAHVGALMAEKDHLDKIIGISMDGTGYGDDGNIWGGEFFVGDYRELTRFGHLKYLFLPSGDKAAKEPWRFALSVLYALYGNSERVRAFAQQFGKKGEFLLEAIEKEAGGILTSSCGRLFDAAAAILGIGNLNTYEGEMPIKLQACAEKSGGTADLYRFSIEEEKNNKILNVLPTIHDIIEDKRDTADKAYLFHRTLARGFADMAIMAGKEYNISTVGLTGGVFQNMMLLEMTKDFLEKEGFSVLIHSEVPPNDGGISLGQAFLAAGKLLKKEI